MLSKNECFLWTRLSDEPGLNISINAKGSPSSSNSFAFTQQSYYNNFGFYDALLIVRFNFPRNRLYGRSLFSRFYVTTTTTPVSKSRNLKDSLLFLVVDLSNFLCRSSIPLSPGSRQNPGGLCSLIKRGTMRSVEPREIPGDGKPNRSPNGSHANDRPAKACSRRSALVPVARCSPVRH